MKYRGIEIKINGPWVTLFNEAGVVRKNATGERASVYNNGEAVFSLPEDLEMAPEAYVRKRIDSLYEAMAYHQEFEEKYYKFDVKPSVHDGLNEKKYK